jgi:uncharacterized protein YgbK (DUF1537 family)
MTKLMLGCIADDFTGATDLANNLVRAGMRVVQVIGVPNAPLDGQADAVVVALKSRTIAADDAVAQSLAALAWLKAQGAAQIYFKYCSTFDSTPAGNIGPVIDALMRALQTDFTIATPAFPENQRTVFKGYLFVGSLLLHESGMQHHPLTPMTDSNLVRVLQAQYPAEVGLIDHTVVATGHAAITARISALKTQGVRCAIVDAVSDQDLIEIARAFKDMPLITGGSGLAIGLPANFGLKPSKSVSELPAPLGLQAVISGSCSAATRRQVAEFIAAGQPAFAIDPIRIANQEDVVAPALAWAASKLNAGPLLIYSTNTPDAVKAIQEQMGVANAGELIEQTLASITRGLLALGVRQLVVAGGETSGACISALGIEQVQIGPQIDPGVPWCYAASTTVTPQGLHLTLKSGNFGTDDFFLKAFKMLA